MAILETQFTLKDLVSTPLGIGLMALCGYALLLVTLGIPLAKNLKKKRIKHRQNSYNQLVSTASSTYVKRFGVTGELNSDDKLDILVMFFTGGLWGPIYYPVKFVLVTFVNVICWICRTVLEKL